MKNSVEFLWENATVAAKFRRGVSLHSHTMHSHENLAFVPKYAGCIPPLAWELARQQEKYKAAKGRYFDFTTSFWIPPLQSRAAFDLEKRQIEEKLDLPALVSLSDHDTIEAGCQLQVVSPEIPISVEWTAPIGATYFHLGIHNLLRDSAREYMSAFASHTRNPVPSRFIELLDHLHASSETLVVLNHPFWDQTGQGQGDHNRFLRQLLELAGSRIHAVELNGLRPWTENRAAAALAREIRLPLISGGDRHGREPNAVLNLTNSAGFAEFSEEIRAGFSDVLFMPQYREPLPLRFLKTIGDVFQEHHEMPGCERWNDRIYYSPDGENTVPVSTAMRDSGPRILRAFIAATCLLGHRRVQRALRHCLNEKQEWAL